MDVNYVLSEDWISYAEDKVISEVGEGEHNHHHGSLVLPVSALWICLPQLLLVSGENTVGAKKEGHNGMYGSDYSIFEVNQFLRSCLDPHWKIDDFEDQEPHNNKSQCSHNFKGIAQHLF